MKTTFYNVLLLISLLSIFGCTERSDKTKIINYIAKHDISPVILKQVADSLVQANNNINCTSCDDISYCGIDSSRLLQYIRNYRDSVWSKTSPYFYTHTYDSNILFNGGPNLNEFDARYLDMDIAKLENYICAIRTSQIGNNANTIRLYYIRYDQDNPPIPNFEGKHSMAMVPVQIDEKGTTVEEYTASLKDPNGKVYSLNGDINDICGNSGIANHNRLCPPYTGCPHGTLLEIADTQ